MARYIEVTTTLDSEEKARIISDFLLENHLASCVQKIGPVVSKYWWQGKIENSKEYILTIKTKENLYKKLEEVIIKLHNYEVPEIIARPIIKGYKKYLDWIEENCSKTKV